jgi:hypothetical protein
MSARIRQKQGTTETVLMVTPIRSTSGSSNPSRFSRNNAILLRPEDVNPLRKNMVIVIPLIVVCVLDTVSALFGLPVALCLAVIVAVVSGGMAFGKSRQNCLSLDEKVSPDTQSK